MDLSNKKWLYVTGCSHTAGCEALTPGDGTLTHECLQKSWSGLLAEEYKLNLINEAYSGAGNEYIMRSALDFVSKWERDGRDINDVLIIQSWSTLERQQFAWDNSRYHIHWATGQDPEYLEDQTGHNFENWFKALGIYATDHIFGVKRRYSNIVLCKNYFESKGIDYIMFNSCAKSDKEWEVDNVQKSFNPLSRFGHLLEQVPNKFFEPYNSFIDQYREDENYKEHISDWLHADAHIHNLYYNKLKTWLETI